MNTLSDSERLNLAYRIAGPHAFRIMRDVLAELGVERLGDLPIEQGSIALAEMESRVYGDKYDAMKKLVAMVEDGVKARRCELMAIVEAGISAAYTPPKEAESVQAIKRIVPFCKEALRVSNSRFPETPLYRLNNVSLTYSDVRGLLASIGENVPESEAAE